jgi:CheY-like chemotaxis protein
MAASTPAEIINAVAGLLWPLIAMLSFLVFRPAIVALIESAKSRKFTLRIGGQELTMEEASSQQHQLIRDLQREVITLRRNWQRVSSEESVPRLGVAESVLSSRKEISTLLWVDDRPKNNSYFIQQLSDSDIVVDLALSTDDALRKLDKIDYDAVISNMARQERGVYNRTAGLDLLKLVRERSTEIPFVIFCSPKRVRQNRTAAQEQGATAITSSAVELFQSLSISDRLNEV